MNLGDNVIIPETIPPLYREFSVQEILIDCIVPHTDPVNSVHDCHMQDCWKLGSMTGDLKPRAEVS